MEKLPAEVLEIIFHPFSKIQDIENCYNTNSKWRHIIKNMYEDKSMHHSLVLLIIRKSEIKIGSLHGN